MFSLVVTVISILLVAGLAAVAVIYGGSVFNTAGAKNSAAALLSQAQQLTAANALYFASNNQYAASAADLVAAGYLQAASTVPTGVKHSSTPDWVPLGSASAPPWTSISPYFYVSNYTPGSMYSLSPAEACRRAIAELNGTSGDEAVLKPWGADLGCFRPADATPRGMVFKQTSGGTSAGILTMAQYDTVALAVSGNNAYVPLLTTGGASDEACKAINQTAVGSSTIAGTADYPAGLGGLNNTAYGAVASNFAGVFFAMTVKFACVRFATDNVLLYKG